jgi:hypothetical protein
MIRTLSAETAPCCFAHLTRSNEFKDSSAMEDFGFTSIVTNSGAGGAAGASCENKGIMASIRGNAIAEREG